MRSSALLTGLTGVVAVLVLAYVGLTAMNLQPHITFGDPRPVVASAGTSSGNPQPEPAVKPATPVPAAAAPSVAIAAAPAAPDTVSPPVAPAQPATSMGAIAPAVPTTVPNSPVDTTAEKADPVDEARQAPVSTASVAKPKSPPPSDSSPVVEPPKAPPLAASAPQASAAPPPAVSEAKREVAPASSPPASEPSSSKPAERDAADRAAWRAELPYAGMIPTPQPRPEEKVAPATQQAASADETPAARDAPAPKPTEETSLPPKEPDAAAKPVEPAPAADTAKPGSDANLKPIDLSRPTTERAGVLTIGNRIIRLAGIEPTDPARSCTGPNGKEWPCGTLARTALRAFLLGRSVTCDVPDPQWTGPVTASCRFARVDLSDWLVRNGWAEPAAGSPLAPAADEARKNGLGIYGDDPRKAHISTLAPEPPAEDPLNPI